MGEIINMITMPTVCKSRFTVKRTVHKYLIYIWFLFITINPKIRICVVSRTHTQAPSSCHILIRFTWTIQLETRSNRITESASLLNNRSVRISPNHEWIIQCDMRTDLTGWLEENQFSHLMDLSISNINLFGLK